LRCEQVPCHCTRALLRPRKPPIFSRIKWTCQLGNDGSEQPSQSSNSSTSSADSKSSGCWLALHPCSDSHSHYKTRREWDWCHLEGGAVHAGLHAASERRGSGPLQCIQNFHLSGFCDMTLCPVIRELPRLPQESAKVHTRAAPSCCPRTGRCFPARRGSMSGALSAHTTRHDATT
jgi:hypothetical protein